MRTLTAKQAEKIRCNLNAFVANFGDVRIEKNPGRKGSFLVYYPADSERFIQYCENIDYLNGWLYGVVQGVLVVKKAKTHIGGKT